MKRNCPVCNADETNSKLFLKKNIEQEKINEYSFASRKIPEFMCHELVRCLSCDLVYVAEPPDQATLSAAYLNANYDSSMEAADAADAYIDVLKTYIKNQPTERALEIGAGNGVFLQRLIDIGYEDVTGVEPSLAAINTAGEKIKKIIVHDIFNQESFKPNSFDLICCFMTLEHVQDPSKLARDSFGLLKPGGLLAFVTHDHSSFVNRSLGNKSPIIDIEHMQLFNESSLNILFAKNRFEIINVVPFKNKYALSYWVKLLPISNALKMKIIRILKFLKCDNFKISINVGNILSIGKKPN